MAVLQGGRQNLPSPCVCYPKDPMWDRVNTQQEATSCNTTQMDDALSPQVFKAPYPYGGKA